MVHNNTHGRFTLRWRSSSVVNSREIVNFDLLRVILLSGVSLQYGQESFGGDLCAWMKK